MSLIDLLIEFSSHVHIRPLFIDSEATNVVDSKIVNARRLTKFFSFFFFFVTPRWLIRQIK